MKAIVQEKFGPPDVLRLADIDMPEVGDRDVLIRMRAASLNPYDWHMLRGDPYVARLIGGVGLARPKSLVAGIDVAGSVEAVGDAVRELKPGDLVVGFGRGTFAEYTLASSDLLVPKPDGLTFEQAAATPMAGVTALRAIQTVGKVQAGQRVLINGAGGGIGTFAVQIAAALGADVTGVCSARNVELVRSLGAARVIDYRQQNFTTAGASFDVILDNVGNHTTRQLRQALTPQGTLLANSGGSPGSVFGPIPSVARMLIVNLFVRQRLQAVLPSVPNGPTQQHLRSLTDLIAAGNVTPVVDRTYSLADVADGLRYVEGGHARAKAVVTI